MNVGFIQLSTSPFISICWLHSIVWKWTLPVEWWTRTHWMVLWSKEWSGVVSGVDKSRCECHFTTVWILTLREDEMSFISVIIERYSVASLIVQHLFSIILFESFLCVVIARSQLQMLMNTVLSFIVHSSDGNSINVNWMRLNKCEYDHVLCIVLPNISFTSHFTFHTILSISLHSLFMIWKMVRPNRTIGWMILKCQQNHQENTWIQRYCWWWWWWFSDWTVI